MRKTLLILIALTAVVLTACQPPPQNYTYTETGRLVNYEVAAHGMYVPGTMMGNYQLRDLAECYDNRGNKMIQFNCSDLDRYEGQNIRFTWSGNPEVGRTAVSRILLVK